MPLVTVSQKGCFVSLTSCLAAEAT